MTHAVRDPPSGDSIAAYDSASFAAGQRCGTRVAACVARLSALELLDRSRWWNRRRRRLMARALVACAEELERADDDDGRPRPEDVSILQEVRLARRSTDPPDGGHVALQPGRYDLLHPERRERGDP